MRLSWLCAFALLFTVSTAHAETHDPSKLAAVAGEWDGAYWQGPMSVPFEMKIEVRDGDASGIFTAVITEVDRRATVEGRVDPVGRIWFLKRYDGSGRGGWSHAVEYEGCLEPDGRTITGNWRIGADTGPFLMNKEPRVFPGAGAETRCHQDALAPIS